MVRHKGHMHNKLLALGSPKRIRIVDLILTYKMRIVNN